MNMDKFPKFCNILLQYEWGKKSEFFFIKNVNLWQHYLVTCSLGSPNVILVKWKFPCNFPPDTLQNVYLKVSLFVKKISVNICKIVAFNFLLQFHIWISKIFLQKNFKK